MTLARRLSSTLGMSRAARVCRGWWTALAVVLVTTAGIAEHNSEIAPHRQGRGSPTDTNVTSNGSRQSGVDVLPPLAKGRISAAIGEDVRAYHAVAQSGVIRLDNADQALSAVFAARGVEFRHGADRWSMAFRGHGDANKAGTASAIAPEATANRVEYRRDSLTEWYVNGPLGLEQGFTLERSPDRPKGEPLTLAFALSGNLTATVAPGGRALTLTRDGSPALRYSGLTAWDADRRDLRTWLEIDGEELRVRVDDAGARYPLTIDPYVQAPTLTAAKPCDASGVCDDGAQGDWFGWAVSISGDASTVVVGAPVKSVNNYSQRGVAYVFVKPSDFDGGWNGGVGPNYFKTKLMADEDPTVHLLLGTSVDISRDGETIVLGAPDPGAAYVYTRPASGWGYYPLQTQVAKLTPIRRTRETFYSFGESVSISGDGATIAVGAPGQEIDSVVYGAAFVYRRPVNGWVNAGESQKRQGDAGTNFGDSVALSDDATTLVVGAPARAASDLASALGEAHVFARGVIPGSPDVYADVAALRPSDAHPLNLFGDAVGVDGLGRTIVVGSDDRTSGNFGGAYVYVRPVNGWGSSGYVMTEIAKLTASDGAANGGTLGISVDISADGNTILAGMDAKSDASPGPFPAYFFAKPAAGWSTSTESTTALPWDNERNDHFGRSTSLSGNGSVAIVGAFGKTIDASTFQGAAYVFTGNTMAPKASVSPSSLAFAVQSLGTTSSPQTVTVTNTGTAPLHVTGVGTFGPFTSTQHCISASPIPPGGTCSESVAFTPLSVGITAGTLTFTDDAGGASGATQQVQLQGTGQKANTVTTITSVSANQVLVGQPVTVFVSVTAEPGSTITPLGLIDVQASTGESCSVPAQSNMHSCSLVFSTPQDRTITATYNGSASLNPSSSSSVPVRVFDFSVSASPSSQSVSGKKASYALTVTGVNASGTPISLGCSGGPQNSTCAVNPASLTLTGATAAAKATVTLPNGVSRGTYQITFTGSSGGIVRSATASLTVK